MLGLRWRPDVPHPFELGRSLELLYLLRIINHGNGYELPEAFCRSTLASNASYFPAMSYRGFGLAEWNGSPDEVTSRHCSKARRPHSAWRFILYQLQLWVRT